MPKLNRFVKKNATDPLTAITDEKSQQRIISTVKAIECFAFCNVIVLGLFQLMAMKFSGTVEMTKVRYLRTYTKSVVSEATIADFLRKNLLMFMMRSPKMSITQIIMSR